MRHWLTGLLLCAWSAVVATAAPTVTITSPTRTVLEPGQSLNLSATASGSGTVTYQWLRKGKAIAGATGATLAITNGAYADGGWYLVDAADSNGTTRSKAIFVTVAPAKTQVRTWGGFFDGQSTVPLVVPSSLTDAVSIAAGDGHMLAVRRDGTVVAWGENRVGQTSVPAGLTNAVAVAAGKYHSVVLKDDGTVVVFGGANTYGQLNIPSGLSGVVAVAAGMTHTLALKKDGTVVVWGSNTIGESNVPPGLTGVVSVSGGDYFSLALGQSGNISGWGTNWAGQLTPPQGLSSAIQIAAAQVHAVALKSDGTVAAWGFADGNNLTVPPGLANVVFISARGRHSMALVANGTVVAWGNNFVAPDSNVADVFAIAAGEIFSAVLRDAANDTVPAIVGQPLDHTLPELGNVTLSVAATGPEPLSYQWRKNGTNISGATTSELKFRYLKLPDAGNYDVVVSNQVGSTNSAVATLTVLPIPVITSQSPSRHVLAPGENLNFNVSATGTGTLAYQWTRNGLPIAGATNNSLSLSNASYQDGGYYLASVTDTNGTRRSAPIFVSVAPAVTLLKVWGENSFGQTDIPSNLTDIVSVKGGGLFTLALKRDGTVSVWGDPYYTDLRTIPAGLSDVVAISAGFSHALALKADGTVVAWGHNYSEETIVPEGLSNVVAVACGNDHSLALRSDGTIVGWGLDFVHQAAFEEALTAVVAIECHDGRSVAIKSNGTAVEWWRYDGPYDSQIIPAGLANLAMVAPGNSHGLALKSDNSVVGWGENTYGQNDIPSSLGPVISIAAGNDHSLALRSDRRVIAWGRDSYGQATVPVDWPDVFDIAAGSTTSLALRDASSDSIPQVVASPVSKSVVETQSATLSVAATSRFGTLLYQWRKNGVNILGASSAELTLSNVLLSDAGNYDVVITNHIGPVTSALAFLTVNPVPVVSSLSASRQFLVPGQPLDLSVGATGTGALRYQWRHNGNDIAGATNAGYSVAAVALQAAGWYTVLITDDYGTRRSATIFVIIAPEITRVRAWGGEGGFSYDGDQVPDGLSGVVKITAGPHHSLVLKRDGTVAAWGYNADGQSTVPTGLSDVVDLTSHFGIGGYGYSLALTSNGTLVQWGGGSEPPAGLTDVVSIAAGINHVLALKSDGTVVSWANGYGYSASTIPPHGLKNVVAIAAGYNRSIALKSDGSVVTWGEPWSDETSMPAGLTNVIAVASGNRHSLALKADGTVVAWGYNGGGPLDVPPSLDNVVAISASAFYSLALKSDGSVVEWGNSGQTTPPADLDNVMAVSAGYYFSLALQYAPIFTSSPADSVHFEKETTSFAVTLFGAGASAYQWRKNGVNIAGATNSTLTLSNLRFADTGDYTVVATNSVGSTTSTAGSLVVFVSPAAKAVVTGQSAAFAVVASGATDSTYQWRRLVSGSSTWNDLSNSGVFSGTTTATLLVNPATLAMSGDQFRCVVTGSAGTTTSEAAVLTVAPARPATFDGQGYLNRYPDLLAEYGALSDRLDLAWIHYYTAGIFAGRSDGDFDPAAYLAQYPELQVTLGNNLQAAALHWYNTGRQEGRRIPAGFDLNSYLTRYPDIAAQFGTDLYGAWLYYRDHGIYDGEVFDDLFRVEEYLALYPDLFAIFGSDLGAALDHWLSTGRIEGKLGRIPLEFKAQGYFDRNTDVATAVGNDPILAWGHYWLYGIYEGRAYDNELRVFEYLAINADLTAAFVNDWRQAALHWMRYGRTEGRLGRLPLTFNVSEYLVRSPDVAAVWGTNPTTVFLHYWIYGIDESRTYDDLFRPNEYLVLNPDLAAALGTDRRLAFKHWVRYGQTEGRPGKNP